MAGSHPTPSRVPREDLYRDTDSDLSCRLAGSAYADAKLQPLTFSLPTEPGTQQVTEHQHLDGKAATCSRNREAGWGGKAAAHTLLNHEVARRQ